MKLSANRKPSQGQSRQWFIGVILMFCIRVHQGYIGYRGYSIKKLPKLVVYLSCPTGCTHFAWTKITSRLFVLSVSTVGVQADFSPQHKQPLQVMRALVGTAYSTRALPVPTLYSRGQSLTRTSRRRKKHIVYKKHEWAC